MTVFCRPAKRNTGFVKSARSGQSAHQFFNNLGQTALSQDQPGQARLAFERGVQYLRNQPDPVTYQQQLLAMEKQLARANSVVLTNTAPTEDDDNELTEGLKQDDTESEWKKKVIYD